MDGQSYQKQKKKNFFSIAQRYVLNCLAGAFSKCKRRGRVRLKSQTISMHGAVRQGQVTCFDEYFAYKVTYSAK
jgi:hypothetical protein